eukprot:scaffold174438_cov32-Tisochrysis_lutea.AAC.2
MDAEKPHFIELVWLKETGTNGQSDKVGPGPTSGIGVAAPAEAHYTLGAFKWLHAEKGWKSATYDTNPINMQSRLSHHHPSPCYIVRFTSKILAAKGYTRNNLISNPKIASSPPGLKARLKKGTNVTPMLYCNLHGVWEGEAIVV